MKRMAAIILALLPAVGGAADLVPAACGVRNTLWIEHYSAQLFVPRGDPAALLSDPAQPKAVRMQILNSFLMPPDIPRKWRDALQRVLDGETMARLAAGYDGLQRGDTVVVSYAPDDGVAVRVNERVLAKAPGHAPIDALLDAWASDERLEKKLAGTLRRNPCA